LTRRLRVEIRLRAAADLARRLPSSGALDLEKGSDVGTMLDRLGIDSDLVMLVVIDGTLADMSSPLSDGMTVELIPPISGG
jgi:molybdopterin converting factor small subunit